MCFALAVACCNKATERYLSGFVHQGRRQNMFQQGANLAK